jgi:hypothetical protein
MELVKLGIKGGGVQEEGHRSAGWIVPPVVGLFPSLDQELVLFGQELGRLGAPDMVRQLPKGALGRVGLVLGICAQKIQQGGLGTFGRQDGRKPREQ